MQRETGSLFFFVRRNRKLILIISQHSEPNSGGIRDTALEIFLRNHKKAAKIWGATPPAPPKTFQAAQLVKADTGEHLKVVQIDKIFNLAAG